MLSTLLALAVLGFDPPRLPPNLGPCTATCAVRVKGVSAAPATIVLTVPVLASVTFDGQPTTSVGRVRTFTTPPLESGKTYSYTVVVCSWGSCQERVIQVTAGQTAAASFFASDPRNAPAVRHAPTYPPMGFGAPAMGFGGFAGGCGSGR